MGGRVEGVAPLSSPGSVTAGRSERRPSEPPCLYRGEGGVKRGRRGGAELHETGSGHEGERRLSPAL